MQENQKIINGIPIAGQWQDYWRWLPSLYMTRGLPYVILMMTSMVFFNRMGMSNGAITLTTSWFFVPLIFRPLLGRIVIGYKSKTFLDSVDGVYHGFMSCRYSPYCDILTLVYMVCHVSYDHSSKCFFA